LELTSEPEATAEPLRPRSPLYGADSMVFVYHFEVRTPAIHLATAIAARADAFVSGDGRLKKVREIPVLSLAEVP